MIPHRNFKLASYFQLNYNEVYLHKQHENFWFCGWMCSILSKNEWMEPCWVSYEALTINSRLIRIIKANCIQTVNKKKRRYFSFSTREKWIIWFYIFGMFSIPFLWNVFDPFSLENSITGEICLLEKKNNNFAPELTAIVGLLRSMFTTQLSTI